MYLYNIISLCISHLSYIWCIDIIEFNYSELVLFVRMDTQQGLS